MFISFVFVNALDGVVFRMNLAYLLDTSTTYTSPSANSTTTTITRTGTELPVTLNMRALLQQGAAAKAQLPHWVKLMRKLDSFSRLHGVCVVPSVPSVVFRNGSRNVAPEWKQQ